MVRRGVVSQHALRQTPPPWTEFLTHASENITLPQTSFAGGNDTLFGVRNLFALDVESHCKVLVTKIN